MTGAELPLAVTMGEPAGVGGEISLMAWRGRDKTQDRPMPPFFMLDDPGRLAALADRIGFDAPVREISAPEDAWDVFRDALPVLPVKLPAEVEPGTLNPANGAAVIQSIDRAVELVYDGRASAVVTNPIHKAALYAAGFKHPGHTEYLAELAGIDTAPIMLLACPQLRVVPVTIHLALAEAIIALKTEDIIHAGRVTAATLTSDFGIDRPRLVVSGLNPHAGEAGHMGDEEIRIIAPAVKQLKSDGMDVRGPAAADTMFHERARATYDAAICMYHDQALIPIKTIDFDGGVNVTAGLPFIRASPDHGTALDIAGAGTANPDSLIAALRLADDMARRRADFNARRAIA
ncbi:MAG: 4-hydroxythreonine-4-phosphate dehydrogenase PdxA [Pseudomonadota bacterium]|nr:4-hydroxythreonine-4-phosphate dehydrogenase PdxA [Pseudomonadota bacterium]